MSTQVVVTDADALRQAIADVRSDANGVNRKSWVLLGHVNNDPNLVEVVSHDTGEDASLQDCIGGLKEDQVMYALLRTSTSVDMSTTVRFVYIHWIGEGVPFVRRGRYGVVHGSIADYFSPYHVIIDTGTLEDLTEEELTKVLEEKSMTVNRIVDAPADRRHERGFTQHQVAHRAGGQPKAYAPTGNQVQVSPELNSAIGEVRQDESPVTWLLAGYDGNNIKKELTLLEKGNGGGIDDIKASIKSDHVMYVLLRTQDVIDAITTVKFVYLNWIGEDVKPLTKGKVYANAGAVEQIFSPHHVALSFNNLEELTDEAVNDKVGGSSGSKSFVK